jgi:hypothetical protein
VERLQGGRARLVQVVQGQQQRLLGGQAAQEGGDRLERPPPLQLGRGPLVAGQVQQPPPAPPRPPAGGTATAPPRSSGPAPPARRWRGQLGRRLHQPGLGDPGLARDRHQARLPAHRPLPGPTQVGQLPVPPHEPGVGRGGRGGGEAGGRRGSPAPCTCLARWWGSRAPSTHLARWPGGSGPIRSPGTVARDRGPRLSLQRPCLGLTPHRPGPRLGPQRPGSGLSPRRGSVADPEGTRSRLSTGSPRRMPRWRTWLSGAGSVPSSSARVWRSRP